MVESYAMAERNFNALIGERWDQGKFLCVGLDPEMHKMPAHLKADDIERSIVEFNRAIVDATKDLVCAFKPNSAFYEAHGESGWRALKTTIEYILSEAPNVAVILDAKRGDIGNTNNGYVTAAFDDLRADAITVHPYMGGESLKEFFDRKEKGIIVLCRTSNSGAGEFQDLELRGEALYKQVARKFATSWNANGNCGLVVGATYPEEIAAVRTIAPNMPFLIPGVGTQGGDLEVSVKAGKDSRGKGIIVSVSRAILYASEKKDFAEVARVKAQEFHGAIQAALVQ